MGQLHVRLKEFNHPLLTVTSYPDCPSAEAFVLHTYVCSNNAMPWAERTVYDILEKCHRILNVCPMHEASNHENRLSRSRIIATMTGKSCLVCANSQFKDPNASFHRFPSDPGRRAIWLRVFHLQESDIKAHHHVCSRHFPNGDAKNDPTTTRGKRFTSPIKKGPRAKRAKVREAKKQLSELYSTVQTQNQ